ncbi:unnamed protein product [Candidula unifasciata]|uniref:MADS-box domain-containing protein n=1 Tax=Candidula unifasciata TaxID=100452 RepID=A0A8S3Z6H9_9EUPU|nr:unnamed protein product [Candidula unifasciata]
MQNIAHPSLSVKGVNGTGVTGLNGNNSNIYVTSQTTIPDNFIFEQVDPSRDEDDSDSDTAAGFGQVSQGHGFQQNTSSSDLKPGKKTKGRVKIKMEFIENKLRRYTTFSKRKTGIMKKAYELSTLTGTQVMLLVASETGHVYTFATRKLQPMITSDSGKALIQTCLNSPDPPPGTPSGNVLEQRMNPSGFEETDLSCAIGEEDLPKAADSSSDQKPVFPSYTQVSIGVKQEQSVAPILREVAPASPATQIVSQVPTFTVQALSKDVSGDIKPGTVSSNSATNNNAHTANNLTMQIPFIFPQGTISMLQQGGQHITMSQSSQSTSVLKPATLSQVVSALSNQNVSSNQTNHMSDLNTPLPVSTPSAINIMQGMTPGIVMYHTPQGVVYATPTQNIHDRTIFNFPQPGTISMTQTDQSSGQQIITFPVPVSLSSASLLHLAAPSIDSSVESTQVVQPPPSKKCKK